MPGTGQPNLRNKLVSGWIVGEISTGVMLVSKPNQIVAGQMTPITEALKMATQAKGAQGALVKLHAIVAAHK